MTQIHVSQLATYVWYRFNAIWHSRARVQRTISHSRVKFLQAHSRVEFLSTRELSYNECVNNLHRIKVKDLMALWYRIFMQSHCQTLCLNLHLWRALRRRAGNTKTRCVLLYNYLAMVTNDDCNFWCKKKTRCVAIP